MSCKIDTYEKKKKKENKIKQILNQESSSNKIKFMYF